MRTTNPAGLLCAAALTLAGGGCASALWSEPEYAGDATASMESEEVGRRKIVAEPSSGMGFGRQIPDANGNVQQTLRDEGAVPFFGSDMLGGRVQNVGDGAQAGDARWGDGDRLLAQGGAGERERDGEGGAADEAPPGEKPDGTAVEPGRSKPLLIYTADLILAVYDVVPTQRAVLALADSLGGFLASQSDQHVTIRIPARRFQDAVGRIEEMGDVLRRNVQALDVTEEFRDLTIRLRNAEAVRARLEELLQKANTVEEALKVQRELAKVTEQIEVMKGRLRYLEDRLAYSTVTVRFQPRPRDPGGAPDTFRLPFPWLDELGLRTLTDLR